MQSNLFGWLCSVSAMFMAFTVAQPALRADDNGLGNLAKGLQLFTLETFGGNGRTCLTCHSLLTGTVSPQDAATRLKYFPNDPLFIFDGSDDGNGNGVTRMLNSATVRIEIPLPPTVRMANGAKSVIVNRSIPSTLNTPALDPVLMWDGRDTSTDKHGNSTSRETQAANAIVRHFQGQAKANEVRKLADFETTDFFFSSKALRDYANGGPAPTLPLGNTPDEQRGRRFFVDQQPLDPRNERGGTCAVCHSGPMLNQTNQFLPLPVAPGSRFISIGVSQGNLGNNPIQDFIFTYPNGQEVKVSSPDPGRALITGVIDGDPATGGGPFFTSLNAFKIQSLWGVSKTAPYFHDNSAKTLEEVVDFYSTFTLPPFGIVLTSQDKKEMLAYLKLLQ